MKRYMIIPIGIFLLSCSNMRPLPIKIIGQKQSKKQDVSDIKDRITCVQEFLHQAVKPLTSNKICSDIFKRR